MIYAPVLAYIVLFQGTAESRRISAEALRQEVRSLLDRAGQQSLLAGYSPEKVRHVRFSIVAFLDEIVLVSNWDNRVAWMDRPLQFEEFETNIAGDQFFDRLEGGAEVDPEVAEIDFLVLSLGFKGRYVGSETELANVRRRLFRKFPPESVLSVPKLTPEAYDHAVEGLVAVDRRGKMWMWLSIAILAGVALIVYAVLQLKLSGAVAAYKDALPPVGR